jgi:transposase
MLEAWLDWAQRCRIGAFVELGRKIKKNIAGIEAVMLHNLSNALIESTNTQAAGAPPHGLRVRPA